MSRISALPFGGSGGHTQQSHLKYHPDAPYPPAGSGADDTLPGSPTAYFLRAGDGPRHVLFGLVAFQVMTGAESGDALGMTVTEGPRGRVVPEHVHERTYEGIYCLDGVLRVRIDGEDHVLTRGDFASIPKGTAHSCVLEAQLTRFVTMYGPAGPERLHELAGDAAAERIFPDGAGTPDAGRLAAAGAEADTAFTA